MRVESGNVVRLHYRLTDTEGAQLDSTEGGEPLSYLHGYGNIIPGLEKQLDGAEEGYTAEVVIEPGDAYGERNPEAVFEIAKDEFPDDFELEAGMVVQAQTPEGVVQLTVDEVTEEKAVLDANHPLAGKTLTFEVEVADVRAATDEEKEHGHPHDGSQPHD